MTFSDHPVLSGGGNSYGIRVAGFNGGKETPAAANAVGPDFFKTLQIPVLYGRDIEGRDEGAGRTSHVVVVNQSFARKFFGRDDAIGGATRFGEVVGVVSDARDSDLKRVEPTFYVPFQHAPFGSPTGARASFAVRLAGSPPALIRSIHQVVSEIDPALALDDVRTQDEHVARLVSQERLFAEVGGFCGVVAAALACVGLFGLIAYSVQQRTTEIGIRVALGAQPWRVMRMILHDALWLLGVGVLLGLVGAMLSLRLVSSLLYGLSFTDPLTYGVVTLLFMAVAIGACLLPARRAARVDPVIALRSE